MSFRLAERAYVDNLLAKHIDTEELAVSSKAHFVDCAISGSTQCNNLFVSGYVQSSHKIVVDDDKNAVQMHSKGALFYLKYEHITKIQSFTTTSGSNIVSLRVTGHELDMDDYVHLGNMAGVVVNGIIGSHLQGTRQVLSKTDADHITFTAGALATSTGTHTQDIPLKVVRYKVTNMAHKVGTWYSTTYEPTETHTNTLDWDGS
jgi:hypothetical protein